MHLIAEMNKTMKIIDKYGCATKKVVHHANTFSKTVRIVSENRRVENNKANMFIGTILKGHQSHDHLSTGLDGIRPALRELQKALCVYSYIYTN